MMPTNGSKDHTVPHQECVLGIETLQHKTKKKKTLTTKLESDTDERFLIEESIPQASGNNFLTDVVLI